MIPIQDPIDGKEDIGDLTSPYQALVQFYHAFNSSDLAMMADNWAQTEDIAMDNPLGGIKRGWEEMNKGQRRPGLVSLHLAPSRRASRRKDIQ